MGAGASSAVKQLTVGTVLRDGEYEWWQGPLPMRIPALQARLEELKASGDTTSAEATTAAKYDTFVKKLQARYGDSTSLILDGNAAAARVG